MKINLNEITFILCVTLLLVLCLGDPDLLDAIIKRFGGY